MDTDTTIAARTGHRPRSSSTDIALISAFAALIVVCAYLPGIALPGVPVPITAQTFAVILSGAVLGARRGLLAVLVYLALGAAGLPVFTGGNGGLGAFAGATVGYLVAFPLTAFTAGFLVERLPRRRSVGRTVAIWACGLAASFLFIHTLGPLGMMLRADMSLRAAFAADAFFYPGDVIKNAVMAIVASAVHAAFPDLLPRPGARRRASGTITE